MKRQIIAHFGSIFYTVFLSVFVFAGQLNAAVTIDNTSSNGASNTITGITTLTWSHTVNACTNCVLYVGVSTFTQLNVATARVQSVTYGAQTLMAVGTQVSPFPMLPTVGNSSVEMFRLIAPSAGTATITVTFLTPVNYAVGGANSLNGVSQTTPNSAFFSNSGNSSTPAVTASDSVFDDLVLDVLGTTPNAVFVAPDASQMLSYDGRGFFGFAFDVGAGSTEIPTALMTPMTWTMTNAGSWAIGAITVKQSLSTASLATISGQLRTKYGNPVVYTTVVLQDLATGEEFYTVTNEKGRYYFGELEVSKLYLVRVVSFRYQFSPSQQLVNLTDAVENLDFIGLSRKRF